MPRIIKLLGYHMQNIKLTEQIMPPRDILSTGTDSVSPLQDPAPSLHLDGNPNQSSAKAGVSLMLVHVACNVCTITSSKAETCMGL